VKSLQRLFAAVFLLFPPLSQRPHPRVGGGHLHLEYASHFRGAHGGFDTLLMRNFIVDISNRPLLFLGGLSRDLLNAPPLAVLPAEQQVCGRANCQCGCRFLSHIATNATPRVPRAHIQPSQKHLRSSFFSAILLDSNQQIERSRFYFHFLVCYHACCLSRPTVHGTHARHPFPFSHPQQVAFTQVVADFDALAVGDRSVENLKKEINDRVYLKSYIQRDHAELQSYNKKQRKYHVRVYCSRTPSIACPFACKHSYLSSYLSFCLHVSHFSTLSRTV
jgi:hypothetical protein